MSKATAQAPAAPAAPSTEGSPLHEPLLRGPVWERRLSTRACLAILVLSCALFWGDVLFGGRVLLPGAMLRGFAPFGGQAQAPWAILQWDALAQYFPWRAFAASELRQGRIPLWNPHQFAGAPFVANGQSAVFYAGSLPFWILDTARAFGIAAFAHSLLAAAGAFALLRRWKLGSLACLFGALAWSLSGYLASWSALPTLAHTASWLPLLLWLFERAAQAPQALAAPEPNTSIPSAQSGWQQSLESRAGRLALFSLTLCCSFLAGHAQIFAFLLLALAWRVLTLEAPLKSLQVLVGAGIWAAVLGALQLLPTVELARLGHRAGSVPTAGGWAGIAAHALQPGELLALAAPGWPMSTGSFNENFPYTGLAVLLLALAGAASVRRWRSPQAFALGLAILGLGTALAWPPARWAYFLVPGAAQLAGVGRALVLWSLGAALLAACGLDALSRRLPQRAQLIALLACSVMILELGLSGWANRMTAAREEIYPATRLTNWLRQNLKPGQRVAFVTPRNDWLPIEWLQQKMRRAHPPGVLPPNGAMVYGLDDVGGYDSLAPAAYRNYLNEGEGGDVAAPFSGNMTLPGAFNSRFDELNVRYMVALSDDTNIPRAARAFEGDGCVVWARALPAGVRKSGLDFSPGVREGKYQPQSFRLGAFLSLCALAALASVLMPRAVRRASST